MACIRIIQRYSWGIVISNHNFWNFQNWLHFAYAAGLNTQIPYAFQHLLSYADTPTVSDTLPAYNAMKELWTEHAETHPETAAIVQKGLDKLNEYRIRADSVPVYTLAMCK